MSGLSAQKQQQPQHAGKIVADLDRLFSEPGIAISGDGDTLVLVADGHHTIKYHRPEDLPRSAQKATKGQPQLRFEGGEHTAIGDSTLLRFVKDAPAIPAWQVELHLPNGLALTYGQVVALGATSMAFPSSRSAKAQPPVIECSALSRRSTPLRYCRPRKTKPGRSLQ
ncbi:hypothetical protein PBOI14_11180 [Pseudomonas sp. Boi14]|nr:hypothetical protein PBOI14_11180 [Pseudomonas sp. Boi14]